MFSGFEVGVEAAERASARRAQARSAWMAENWGPRRSDVEREVLECNAAADWQARPLSEVDLPSRESGSTDLRSAFVEGLLASRDRMCEGFVGEGRTVHEQVIALLGDVAWFEFSAADVLAFAVLAQTFEDAIARAVSNAFDLVLEHDDALWAQAEYDKGVFYLPECTSTLDPARETEVVFTRAQACSPWLVRYVVDCAKDPRIQAIHNQIRALQLERTAALRAAAEQWRMQ
jgi:hypothetical protein